MKGFRAIVPGVISCFSISLLAQVIGQLIPHLGAAFIAIILGIILGNTLLKQSVLAKGVKFSESKLLEIAIALTGLTLSVSTVMSIGGTGIIYIVLQMSLTIAVVYWLGKSLGFSKKFSLLMGAGNGVCGSSAIATVTPVIEAEEKDKGLAITTVNLTGTVLMMALPILTSWFYQQDLFQTSAMIGGTLQSVGQVVASGKLVNDEVAQLATVFKILRVILLVGVVFLYSRMNLTEGVSLFSRGNKKQETKKSVGIPWFIKVFFLFCLLGSLIKIPNYFIMAIKQWSNQLEIIALAGIGMRVKVKDLISEGPKAMGYGLLIGVGQLVFAYILIYLLFK